MSAMIRRIKNASPPALALLAALAASGCAENVSATPLDSSKAREALKATLDAWRGGNSVDSLKSNSPPIVAQDMEWQGGSTLSDYQIEGEGQKVDSNLKIPVKLTLKQGGKSASKKVTYLVT